MSDALENIRSRDKVAILYGVSKSKFSRNPRGIGMCWIIFPSLFGSVRSPSPANVLACHLNSLDCELNSPANFIDFWTALWRSSCIYNGNNGRGRCLLFDMSRGSEWHPSRLDWLRSSRASHSPLRPLFALSILLYAPAACGQSAVSSSSVHSNLSQSLRSRSFSLKCHAWTGARWVPFAISLNHRPLRFNSGRFFGVCWKLSLEHRRGSICLWNCMGWGRWRQSSWSNSWSAVLLAENDLWKPRSLSLQRSALAWNGAYKWEKLCR